MKTFKYQTYKLVYKKHFYDIVKLAKNFWINEKYKISSANYNYSINDCIEQKQDLKFAYIYCYAKRLYLENYNEKV